MMNEIFKNISQAESQLRTIFIFDHSFIKMSNVNTGKINFSLYSPINPNAES